MLGIVEEVSLCKPARHGSHSGDFSRLLGCLRTVFDFADLCLLDGINLARDPLLRRRRYFGSRSCDHLARLAMRGPHHLIDCDRAQGRSASRGMPQQRIGDAAKGCLADKAPARHWGGTLESFVCNLKMRTSYLNCTPLLLLRT